MVRRARKWWPIEREYLVPEATVTRTSGRPAIYLPLSMAEELPPGTRVALLIMVKPATVSAREHVDTEPE